MNRRRLVKGILAACAMLVIILDAKTAVGAAQDGIDLCIRTVIPSLFPFFVLSGIINTCLLGQKIAILRPLGRLCKIPAGSESLMLLGFISGYPVGAQLITQSYKEGKFTKSCAERMLGFCSNAGPAFVFGMLSPLFDNLGIVWALWGIHILSGLIVGWVLPGNTEAMFKVESGKPVTLVRSIQNAIRVMGSVCGWVIAFRVMIGFCDRWFLWMLPSDAQVLFSGFLELSNGCVLLQKISNSGIRFILASVMLSFGGVCVAMQTLSVTEGLGTGLYFPGKVLQTALSFLFAGIAQSVLFPDTNNANIPVSITVTLAIILSVVLYCLCRKKVVAFGRKLLYNNLN